MVFNASPGYSTGQPQKRESCETASGSQCQQDAMLAVASPNCCGNSCCRRCASTIEKTISDRVKHLQTGRDLEQEMLFNPVNRLACLPLTGSTYRFLKHQFRIVNDYLTENVVSKTGNLWGAIFHLRLIGARIRAARRSLSDIATTCDESDNSQASTRMSR